MRQRELTGNSEVLVCMFKKILDYFLLEKKLSDWHVFAEPRPYVSVMCIAHDADGNFPLIWRTDKVRSAKNCWSLPSGLHEVGLTAEQQMIVELEEELNLTGFPGTSKFIGHYENIRPDGPSVPGWHWVILVCTIQIKDIVVIQNKEPEKHKVEVVNFKDTWYNREWSAGLGQFISDHKWDIHSQIKSVIS